MSLRDNAITNSATGLLQFFAIPLIFSAIFCFLVGIPFTKFWGIVFKVLYDYSITIWGFVSNPNFMNFVHQLFRKIVFMT